MIEKEKRRQKYSAKSESTNQQEFQTLQAPSKNQAKELCNLGGLKAYMVHSNQTICATKCFVVLIGLMAKILASLARKEKAFFKAVY